MQDSFSILMEKVHLRHLYTSELASDELGEELQVEKVRARAVSSSHVRARVRVRLRTRVCVREYLHACAECVHLCRYPCLDHVRARACMHAATQRRDGQS